MAEEIRNNEREEQVEKTEKIDLGASLRKERKEKKPVNRKVLLLVAVLVIAAVAALAFVLPRVLTPKAEENIREDLTVDLASYMSADVVSILVEGENTFTLTRSGTGEEMVYHMSLMEEEVVNQGTCSSAFIQAATLTADQLVEADAADPAKYGLDDPSSVLTVEYTDGNKIVLEMGDTLEVSGQVYCRLQGDDDVYALRKYLHQIYGGSVLRYRDLSLPAVSSDLKQTRSIIVRQRGEEQVRFLPQDDSASISTTWKMTEPEELWLDSVAVSELVTAVSSVQLYEYQGRFTDLAQFGLDEPRIEVIMSDTQGGKRTLRFGDTAPEGDRCYVTIDDSGDVFTVYKTYTGAFDDFRVSTYLDTFTNIIAISYVDEMEITDGKTTHHLAIEREEQYEEDGSLKMLSNGKPDYLETFFVNGKEVQDKAFKNAYQTVISVTISNVAEQELVDETQTPVLSVTYYLNNGQEPIQVEYLPYDINNYCVRRDGKINLICKRELVDPIMPAMQSLINGELDEE